MKILATILILGLASFAAQAHHNYFTEFNPRVEITLKGVVTKVDWKNPHIEIFIDVTDDLGNVTNWRMPNAGPFIAAQNGWDENTLSVGEELVFIGWPSRNGDNAMRAIEMFFADGRSYEMQMWCKLDCAGHDLDGN